VRAAKIARRSSSVGSGLISSSIGRSLKGSSRSDDSYRRMSRRILSLLFVVALGAVAPAAASPPSPPGSGTKPPAKPRRSWADAQIRVVVSRGLMAPDVASFRPDDPLTQGALAALVGGLTGRQAAPVAKPAAPVTIAGLDAKLVRALGLAPTAASFLRSARTVGLSPPRRFGTEVAARLLGLRYNHPAGQDDLELRPNDTATRAETAYSAARILRFRGGEVPAVQSVASSFELPPLTTWQRRILTTASSFVGYPYVWGGTSERAGAPGGVKARGGFDCSGFVWRVYKLQPYDGEGTLAEVLRGRTTYAMSGEVPRAKRIPFAKLQPADVIFFGSAGPRSRPAQVDHMGIYVGGGWFVHSSGNGVTLTQLQGWYRDRFAWARRPLAEAGLATETAPPSPG
jgi:cell wall-associated NlpC family hydrolase